MNCDGDLEIEEIKGKGKGFVLFCFVFFVLGRCPCFDLPGL